MGTAQDEVRRRMNEAKLKHSVATLNEKRLVIDVKPTSATPGSSTASQVKPAIPVGFYDDAIADAKARKVDVKQLAEKQLESEWNAFQEFAAEVEQRSAIEEKQQLEETKEHEAVEQLENMQYVDRYRVALERATSLRNGETKSKKIKRMLEIKAEDLDAQDGDVESSCTINARLDGYKKSKRIRKQLLEDDKSNDEVHLYNWRSRGI